MDELLMPELISRLLNIISDPVVVIVIVSFGITITVLWKLFEKQHEFIRERVELLRQENEDLRHQILIFRDENERLKKVTMMLTSTIDDLRAQPLLTQNQLDEIRKVSETAIRAAEQSIPITNKLVQLNENLFITQREGFNQLAYALERKAPYLEIVDIVQELIRIVGKNQQNLSENIRQLEERAHRL
jgi:hypothetical protein